MANETPISQKVYVSREENRNLIIEELKKYLELENVDLVKSSFLSFVVEALATLTSNLIFYQTSVYREFFLTKAQLPESIYNLAAFLGYEAGLANYADVDVLFEMPFGFSEDTTFIIPEGFKVFATDSVEFATYYTTTITVTGNSSVQIVAQEGTKIFDIPVVVSAESFAFALNVRQLTTEIQEFQVASDLQTYQFYSLDVVFSGKLADIIVEVREPGQTGWDVYDSYESLYLMDENTKGYVMRRSDTGVNISFGNGIIGYQPPAGSTVRIALTLTEGEDGNAIAGSIRTGERIYNETDAGVNELVSYTVVNTIGATGGSDEEGVEEVRRNSIINITALERTVTEQDYIDSNVIIDDSPIGPNSLPVLKRSDVKVNEISLFITLLYLDDIVPTRNAFETFYDLVVPRKTVLNVNGVDFYTLFDMVIEPLNTVADYNYVLFEFEQVPSLITSFNSDYSLYADNLVVTTSGSQATYRLKYNTTASDPEDVTAEMQILETGATYTMINDTTANEFILTFPDYTVIAEGELTYYFTLEHLTEGPIGKYQNTFILRQSLENYTRSNVVPVGGTTNIVYDIPVIEKEYYDELESQREFESQVLQSLLSTLTFGDYKMMTDFVNVKFGNTTGELQNMQLDEINTEAVIDFRSIPGTGPFPCIVDERYIILKGVDEWEDKDGQIAECILAPGGLSNTWEYSIPNTDDIVYITNKSAKYVYGAGGWVLPNYVIPLQITLDVFQTDEYTGSISNLAASVRTALVVAFQDRFGIEVDIYRSEIVDVVQSVDGVDHCRLLAPESNIFFNFDLKNLTQDELLEYGPEYVYFTEDSIEVKIFK